jgi:hypothetical protein
MSASLEHPSPAPGSSSESKRLAGFGLAGFGLAALGGLLIGVGALMPWIRSSVEGLPDEFSPTYYGIDLADGMVALLAGLVMLLALAATRIASSPGGRRTAAIVVIAASAVAFTAAGVAVITAASRFEEPAVDEVVAGTFGDDVTPEQRGQIEDLIQIRLAPAAFAVLGGGLLGVVGGVMLLSWARRTDGDEPVTSDDRADPVEVEADS